MACGCSKRAKAAARGQIIAGYRVYMPDGAVIPPLGQSPFFSVPEARAEVRAQGGGSVHTEYRSVA